jgi:enamine deaminase RidA (YjgF/YER057c/UK114 family)
VKAQALRPSHFPWFDYSRYSFSLGLSVDSSLYLSGHSASEHDPERGGIVVRGGMEEQARTAWTKIAAILEAGGCSLTDIVRVVEYVTPAGIEVYGQAARIRSELLSRAQPALNTVVVQQLLRPQALIEIEVVAGPLGTAQRSRSAEASESGRSPERQSMGNESARCAYKGDAEGTVKPISAGRENDGIVYLSSLLPIDERGSVVAPRDVVGQTRAIFQRAAPVLDSFGLGLNNVVKTVDYLTPQALENYKRTAEVRREYFAPVFPAATGIIMPRVAHSAALIQIDIIAARGSRAVINPGWSTYEKLTYSPAIRAGNCLFISGHAALDPHTGRSVHPGDILTQSEYIYGKILDIVAAAGGEPEHLVKTIEYVTPSGLPRYREIANVRTRVMRSPFPASTGVVCERLLRPEFQLEVDSFAIMA